MTTTSADDRLHAATPRIIWAFDRHGVCTMSEGPGLAALGLEPGQLVGQDLFALYGRSEVGGANMQRALSGEAFTSQQDVGGVVLETTYQPVRGPDGTVTQVLGISIDITERLRLDERLRTARERASALADLSLQLGQAAHDPSLAVETALRTATTMLGDVGFVWVTGAGTTEPVTVVWHPDGPLRQELTRMARARAQGVREMIQAVDGLATPQVIDDVRPFMQQVSGDVLSAHGAGLDLRQGLNVPLGSRGRAIGLMAILRDVDRPGFDDEDLSLATDIAERAAVAVDNARLLAEQRTLTANLRRFQALVETSVDFIGMADLDGRILYVNPGGRELVGLEPETELDGLSIDEFLTEEGRRVARDVERPVVLKLGHHEGESTLRHWGGGEPVPVATSTFVVRDPLTRQAMAFGTVQRDISDRLEAEAALRDLAQQRKHLLDRLVQVQEDERATIAADVHDDSVQALAAVDLRLGLLLRRARVEAPDLEEQLSTLLRTVRGATERLRSLLFDLEGPARDADLSDVLRDAAGHVFEDEDVRWTVSVSVGAEPPESIRVTAYRIVTEALVNVRKHARAATVQIDVREEGGGLLGTVCDDGVGPGATAEEVASVPGHRGLVTMRDRASVAGGRWELAERPGGGTVVTFWLPYPVD
jgi:PAS domain S-box-containing protein